MQLVFNIVLGELANTKKLKKKKGGGCRKERGKPKRINWKTIRSN